MGQWAWFQLDKHYLVCITDEYTLCVFDAHAFSISTVAIKSIYMYNGYGGWITTTHQEQLISIIHKPWGASPESGT